MIKDGILLMSGSEICKVERIVVAFSFSSRIISFAAANLSASERFLAPSIVFWFSIRTLFSQ